MKDKQTVQNLTSDHSDVVDTANIEFSDLFCIEEMQKLQDAFADAFGIASIITLPDGTPLTRPSRYTELCHDVIHKTDIGRKNCQMLNPPGNCCDPDKSAVRCEICGKWDICTGITVGNRLLAIWQAGQIRTPETTDEELLSYAVKIGANIEDYRRCIASTPVMTREMLTNVARVMAEMTQLLTRTAYQNLQLKQMHTEKKFGEELKTASTLTEKAFELAKAGYWSIRFDDSEYYISSPRTAMLFGDFPKPDWRYHIVNEWLPNVKAADPDIVKKVYQSFIDLIEGRSQKFDEVYPYRRPVDGRVVWIHATADLMRDENQQPLEMYGVIQDITSQVEAEQALKESQQHLDIAIRGAWLGLWDWQPETGALNTSEIWAEMLGYSAAELDSLYPQGFERWQALLHPEDLARIWQDVQDHLDGISPTYRAEFRLKTKSGRWKWILAIGKCVKRNAAGKGTRMIGFHIDIDEQKNNEEKLAKAKATAEDATVAKSSFLANMSHEIRTPMNAIIGMTQLALQTELTPQQLNYIEKVNIAAQSLLGIINDILDFSKIEAGKMSIDQSEFRLEDVLNNFAVMISLKAEEKGLDLLFDIARDIPATLLGDPLRLNQIITNLGSNAVKFTDSGEIVVAIEQINAGPTYTELHFQVKDTGSGIDTTQQSKLFLPFSQVDGSANRQSGGTGLGLVISRSLVEGMNGKIWFESQPGQGTTFHFTARFGIKRQLLHRQACQPRLGEKRAILLARNTTECNILRHCLETSGMQVESHSDCNNMLKRLEELHEFDKLPDLLIASSDATGTNSVDCALKIRNSSFPDIPMILVTSAHQLAKVLFSIEQLDINSIRVLGRPVFQEKLHATTCEVLGLLRTPASIVPAPANMAQSLALAGARLLLVEDNALNQELAIELLERAGITVVLARNGQESLDILAGDKDFDGILMDCQMPVMDGYTASSRIRQMPELVNIPIIAMTADVMTGDREKAIDSGMNDHIAKPLNVSNMFAILGQWIKSRARETQAPKTLLPPVTTGMIFPELAGIDTQRALSNLLNNTALYQKMLVGFYNNYSNFREQFMACLTDEDRTATTRYAHSLKSSAGNIGATSLQAVAARLEQACKSGASPDILTGLIEETSHEAMRVHKEIEKVLTQISDQIITEKSPEPDQTELSSAVEMLRQLLLESDSEAVVMLEQNREVLQSGLPEKFDQLEEMIRNYEFEDALNLLTDS
ncbi:MAG: hypothetical protein CVV42_07395 [Candidatus Riflebacteria bacterium HGW-Riflebacteria-2]|jgi:PAS domain S-box-containing protein|nr:MAG: hypothetical protein CVV42_07395 [Candidatus Riflebacteria bacterium HGW-Riflebacteria-2]